MYLHIFRITQKYEPRKKIAYNKGETCFVNKGYVYIHGPKLNLISLGSYEGKVISSKLETVETCMFIN